MVRGDIIECALIDFLVSPLLQVSGCVCRKGSEGLWGGKCTIISNTGSFFSVGHRFILYTCRS